MDNAELLRRLRSTFRLEAEERLNAMSGALAELEGPAHRSRRGEYIETLFREAHSLKGAARAVDMPEFEAVCQALESVLDELKKGRLPLGASLLELLQRVIDTLAGAGEADDEAFGGKAQRLVVELQGVMRGGRGSAPASEERAQRAAPDSAAAETAERPDAATRAADGQEETESAESAESADPAGSAGSANSADSGDSADTPDPADSAEPTDAAADAMGARTSGPVQSVESAPGPVDDPRSKPAPARSGGPQAREQDSAAEVARVPVRKLEEVLRQTEALLLPRLAAGQLVGELHELAAQLPRWRKGSAAIQASIRHVARQSQDSDPGRQVLSEVLAYLESEAVRLKYLEERLARLGAKAERDWRTLSTVVTGLQDDVKELHMMPFSSLLDPFPRLVREIARERGKEVRLSIAGQAIEADRRLLQELRDPLTHLLRNAVDHGIEDPETRRRAGKRPQGTIVVQVSQSHSSKIELLLADDGAGVDEGRLRRLLLDEGLAEPDALEQMQRGELLEFLFHSGVTTSPTVTELSGRGLGLAIVRERVERLGGLVALRSESGRGTEFRLTLPLTVATYHALLVRAGGLTYALPATAVERVVRLASDQVGSVENRPTVVVDGQTLALSRLAEVLGAPASPAPASPAVPASPGPASRAVPGSTAPASPGPESPAARDRFSAVILAGPPRTLLQVDEIVGEQEVLVKPLGPQLARVRNVAGATVLPDGSVAPVLNVGDLLQAGPARQGPQPAAGAVTEGDANGRRRSVLVVEDSITSRSLLKGILESAGYLVATAVDGIDGFTRLQTEPFDLLVSDVDMPRMNGLELVAKVRGTRGLADIPAVLVTSLDTPADRQRGAEAGANAYIVKSGFDQSSLLDAVRRLIG